jgi:hypothetical protein
MDRAVGASRWSDGRRHGAPGPAHRRAPGGKDVAKQAEVQDPRCDGQVEAIAGEAGAT